MSANSILGALPFEWEQAMGSGYMPYLLPIVTDPKAEISPTSKLKDVCKQPSVFTANRQVIGFAGWTTHVTTPEELTRWRTDPAMGLGIRCGSESGIVCVDFDIEDEEMQAACLKAISEKHAGTPVRRRKGTTHFMACLRLSPFTLEQKLSYRRITTEKGIIEFLGDGKQIMAFGTHKTGNRVAWSSDPFKGPVWTLDEVDNLFNEFIEHFGAEGSEAVPRERQQLPTVVMEDPVVDFLRTNGWVICETPSALNIKCPWGHEHSGGVEGDGSTQWMKAGGRGYDRGHFRCLHAHCHERKDGAFFEAIGYKPVQSSHLTAIDLPAVAIPSEEDQAYTQILNANFDEKRGVVRGMMQTTLAMLSLPMRSGVEFKYDAFRDCELVRYSGRNWNEVTDEDITKIWVSIEPEIQPLNEKWISRAITVIAKRHEIDTGVDWANSLPAWDGVKRIERFCSDCLGAEDTEYAKEVGKYIFTAAAGRLLSPGVKADIMPVLVGEQGCGKSTAVMAIAPTADTYREVDLTAKDDEIRRILRGISIGEVNELNGLSGRAIESVKALISRQTEVWIPKYRERATTYARRCLFIGTTNSHTFLSDPSGSRRFAPIEVGLLHRVDLEKIKADHDQLWAEGIARFRAEGIPHTALEVEARQCSKDFEDIDPWQERLQAWLNEQEQAGNPYPDVELSDLLTNVIGLTVGKTSQRDTRRLAALLRPLGYARASVKVNGVVTHPWRRTASGTASTTRYCD